MSELILGALSQDDLEFDGFLDGQQKLIPDETEVEIIVTDAFFGVEEGKAIQVCQVFVTLTAPKEFIGQKYKFNAKIFDLDAAKRDRALKNLQLLDTQAGSPLSTGRLPISTETMQEYWVGKAHARAKMGLVTVESEDGGTRSVNFIRGFGFLRSKIPATQAAAEQQVSQSQATSSPDPVKEKDDDIGF